MTMVDKEQDQELTALFRDADTPLLTDEFTQQVMLNVRKESQRETLLWITGCAVLLLLMWLLSPYIQGASTWIADLPSDAMVMLFPGQNALLSSPYLFILGLPLGGYLYLSKFARNWI